MPKKRIAGLILMILEGIACLKIPPSIQKILDGEGGVIWPAVGFFLPGIIGFSLFMFSFNKKKEDKDNSTVRKNGNAVTIVLVLTVIYVIFRVGMGIKLMKTPSEKSEEKETSSGSQAENKKEQTEETDVTTVEKNPTTKQTPAKTNNSSDSSKSEKALPEVILEKVVELPKDFKPSKFKYDLEVDGKSVNNKTLYDTSSPIKIRLSGTTEVKKVKVYLNSTLYVSYDFDFENNIAVLSGGPYIDNVLSTITPETDNSDTNKKTSGKYKKNISWKVDENGTLTISGNGAINHDDERNEEYPWVVQNSAIKKVVFEKGITVVGFYALEGLDNIEEVYFPETVTRIGSYAQEDNDGTIGGGPLSGVEKLKKISVDSNNTRYFTIDGVLFEYFNNDSRIIILRNYPAAKKGSTYTIPDNVAGIWHGAFENNCYLERIDLPNDMKVIGFFAFNTCNALKGISIPDNTKLGTEVFANCKNLSYIHLGKGIDTIDEYMFFGCPKLKEVYIPSDVKKIGEKAFGYTGTIEKTKGFKIYCFSGSEGERYAKSNGFDYTVMD